RQLIKRWQGHRAGIKGIAAHPTRSLFFTASNDYTLHSYDSLGNLITSIEGQTEPIADFAFSPDGKWMAAIYQDSILRVIAVESGKEQSRSIPGGIIYSLAFHPTLNLLATAGKEGRLAVYDVRNGENLLRAAISQVSIRKVQWNDKGDQLLLTGDEGFAQVISYQTGKVIHNLQGHRGAILDADISDKGLYAVTAGYDSTVRVYDLNTGKVLFTYDGFRRKISHARFSPEGLYFIYCEGSTLYLHETITGKLLHVLDDHTWFIHDVKFSPDSRYLLSAGADQQAILYDVQSGRSKYKIDGNKAAVYSVSFNHLGTYFALAGGDQLVRVFETSTGKEKHVLQGHFAPLRKVAFTPDGQHLLSIGRGHQAVLWDFSTGKQMYSRLQLKGDDWLLYDSDFRYDGSTGARNALYFVCGLETIALEQTNDALFVPGLAEKQFYHQEINYPRLADLELCGTLPVIIPQSGGVNPFQFQITPRAAEIEEVQIYVNERLTKTIPKSSLKTVNGQLVLDLDGNEITPLFSSANPNKVEVVAVTNKGGKDIKTRGAIELPDQAGANTGVVPNLYAVMIGVNTYQDPALKLTYPVKDALALGKAIELSAGEFLGAEHVFMYTINSEVRPGTGYATPERDNIRRALEEIGQLAKPEDVVLIFFAGHGMMNGLVEQKFTLLTAEATKEKIVGISTTDLQSWLSPDGPHKMKANKMILIFDACNSGQASKELFTMMSYNEDRTNRIRQIEDLKEKSGLLIMAASAPNQNAYELPQFEQGLLTYCLLKTLKNNPDILDDQEFLNVTKWFLESERELQKVMESIGKNQDAQPFGTSNLRIGIVNDSIRSTIRIAEEKPQVYCTSAENTETFGDDLQLQREINQALEVRARGMDAKISYVSRQTTTAHSVKLKYSVKKGRVKCKVILLKNNMPYFQGDISGTEDEVARIAAQIVRLVEANVLP
ncbi:MAG: WD40 domain-containing protein, partial [Bacteroidia bacterium]